MVSPLIPRNLIDHRVYDHASVPATIEAIFGLSSLTQRDAGANNPTALVTLAVPRTDTPARLPQTAQSTDSLAAMGNVPSTAAALATANTGNLPGFLHAALASDLALSPAAEHPAIMSQFRAIKTRADAQRYLDTVAPKVRAGRAAAKHVKDRRKAGE